MIHILGFVLSRDERIKPVLAPHAWYVCGQLTGMLCTGPYINSAQSNHWEDFMDTNTSLANQFISTVAKVSEIFSLFPDCYKD